MLLLCSHLLSREGRGKGEKTDEEEEEEEEKEEEEGERGAHLICCFFLLPLIFSTQKTIPSTLMSRQHLSRQRDVFLLIF